VCQLGPARTPKKVAQPIITIFRAFADTTAAAGTFATGSRGLLDWCNVHCCHLGAPSTCIDHGVGVTKYKHPNAVRTCCDLSGGPNTSPGPTECIYSSPPTGTHAPALYLPLPCTGSTVDPVAPGSDTKEEEFEEGDSTVLRNLGDLTPAFAVSVPAIRVGKGFSSDVTGDGPRTPMRDAFENTNDPWSFLPSSGRLKVSVSQTSRQLLNGLSYGTSFRTVEDAWEKLSVTVSRVGKGFSSDVTGDGPRTPVRDAFENTNDPWSFLPSSGRLKVSVSQTSRQLLNGLSYGILLQTVVTERLTVSQ
jgi:hypothetical protein